MAILAIAFATLLAGVGLLLVLAVTTRSTDEFIERGFSTPTTRQ